MNVRKAIDYSELFQALTEAVHAEMPQMERYCEIGRLVSQRPEKGAAVAASNYLTEQYPELAGFSPRNLRRMRNFYKMYADAPERLATAKQIGWTQNIVILEADLTAEQRAWYLKAVSEFGWSKNELKKAIEISMHEETPLDSLTDPCYTMDITQESEYNKNDQDTLYLSRKHLPKPDGRVCHERPCEESRTGAGISNRVRRYQSGGNRQPSLSSRLPVAQRARDRLLRQDGPAASQSGLREIRSFDWNGQSESPQYVSHLRWRLFRQNAPPDGFYRSPRRCCRPLVHKGFQGYMAGCNRRMSGAA